MIALSLGVLLVLASVVLLFVAFTPHMEGTGTALRWLLLGVSSGALGIALIVSWASTCQGIDYSHGERSGRVVKLSRRGWLWPTWEGELQLAGDASFSAATWDFSVQSDAIANELTAHITTGDRIVVRYREFFLRGPAFGSTGYDVVEVRK